MFSRLLFPTLFLDENPAGGGGSPVTAPARPAVPPERRRETLVDRLMTRHGGAEGALAFLATANVTQEDTIERLTRENDDFRRRLPEGSVVITAAEAKNLEKLKALGSVDEVVKGAEELKAFKAEKAERETKDAAKTLAKAAGWDEEAFASLYLDRKLKGEVRNVEVTEQGKKVTKGVLYLQAGEKEPYVAATEFFAKLPAHEQRALTPAPADGKPTASGAPASTGVHFPSSTSTTPVGQQADPVAQRLATSNARAAAKPHPILGPKPQPQAPVPAGAAS